MNNTILVNHNKNWGLDEILVKTLSQKALKEKGFESDIELSIYFVGRKKARDLNISYLQKDYYPQVLGFPMSQNKDADGKISLGDIVICTQKLKYEVEFYNNDRTNDI